VVAPVVALDHHGLARVEHGELADRVLPEVRRGRRVVRVRAGAVGQPQRRGVDHPAGQLEAVPVVAAERTGGDVEGVDPQLAGVVTGDGALEHRVQGAAVG
jgi:hypothetical protein